MNHAAILGLGLLQLTGMNDITQDNNNWLTMGGKDPYVWVNVQQVDEAVKGILIDYEIKNAPKEYGTEVYYSTNLHSFSEQFKQYFKIKNKPQNLLYVPLDLINQEQLQSFRLDFDQCSGCQVKINKMLMIGVDEQLQLGAYQPAGYQSKLEQKVIITRPDGKQLSISEPFIWKVPPENTKSVTGLMLKYQIRDFPDFYRPQVYYSTNLHLFSETFKYEFSIKGQAENTLFIPFDLLEDEALRAVMLNFEDCPGCRIELSAFELVDTSESSELVTFIPEDYQSHREQKQQNLSTKGMRLQLEDFTLKDFKIMGNNQIEVTGLEPRMDSPALELPINEFAGVYLRLKVPAAQKTGMYINLDWNTSRYGHRKKMVTRWVGNDEKLAELFVPFEPISGEQWLNYFWIRFEPSLGDKYSVEEIMVIPKRNKQMFAEFTPSIANFPGGTSTPVGLITGGIKRMLQDWVFTLIYALLLAGVVFFLIIGLKKVAR